MALVADENRHHVVVRPPWVRRRSNEHEPFLAAFMLGLVVVGVVALFMSGQLLQLIAPRGFLSGGPVAERPLQGAAAVTVSNGKTVVVALNPPATATAEPVAAVQPLVLAPDVAQSAPSVIADAPAAESARDQALDEAALIPAAVPTTVAASAAAATPAVPGNQALESGRRVRVVNTDGRGVVLYSAPHQGGRQPAGLLEGTTVSVLETFGADWVRVQADSRRTGWVRAEYLAPAE